MYYRYPGTNMDPTHVILTKYIEPRTTLLVYIFFSPQLLPGTLVFCTASIIVQFESGKKV